MESDGEKSWKRGASHGHRREDDGLALSNSGTGGTSGKPKSKKKNARQERIQAREDKGDPKNSKYSRKNDTGGYLSKKRNGPYDSSELKKKRKEN